MYTNTNTIFTHGELKRGLIPGSMETYGAEVNLWSCWVSDLLDNSEPSSRVFFFFDNILLLVVPTAAICFSKGMIPLETIKRDMATLGIITKSLLVPLVLVPKIGTRSEHVACLLNTSMHIT